ncbi:MAG: glycosyltransferase family 4 protein [Cyclobacteriaceae bacterium]|nr:glycosyltransferase family 4 protein [Cyclobacteriaceae bacterium]
MRSLQYTDLLVGIYLFSFKNAISVFVVHSTKMHWLLELRRWFPKIRIISYHHSSEDQNCPEDVFKKVVENIDAHIFVSRFGEVAFFQKANSLNLKRKLISATIQNGVDVHQFKPYPESRLGWLAKYKLCPGKVTILFAGRIIHRKGLHLLLEAMDSFDEQSCNQVQLLVAGGADFFSDQPTPYIVKIRETISLLKQRIHVVELGYVPHSYVHELFAISDIFTFTSIEPEGSPLALIEAACCGLPVISGGIGGISEIVQHNISGFILDMPLNPVQLTEHLLRLIHDKNLLLEMSNNALAISKKRFSSQRMASDFLNVMNSFNEIMGK